MLDPNHFAFMVGKGNQKGQPVNILFRLAKRRDNETL
jgi:hypothetical protein